MFRLAQLQRKIERLNKFARAKSEETPHANKEQTQTEVLKVWMEVRTVEDEIQSFKTHQLIKAANHLGLPTPSFLDEEAWDSDSNNKYKQHHLSLKAQTQLRKDIRQEKKERREMWTMVVKDIIAPIGGIVISVLSLLIAYAALKLKH